MTSSRRLCCLRCLPVCTRSLACTRPPSPALICTRLHIRLSLLPRPRQRFARHRGTAHCTHSNTNTRPQSTPRGKTKTEPQLSHGPAPLVRWPDESPALQYRSLNSTALRVDKALAIYGTRVIRPPFHSLIGLHLQPMPALRFPEMARLHLLSAQELPEFPVPVKP